MGMGNDIHVVGQAGRHGRVIETIGDPGCPSRTAWPSRVSPNEEFCWSRDTPLTATDCSPQGTWSYCIKPSASRILPWAQKSCVADPEFLLSQDFVG